MQVDMRRAAAKRAHTPLLGAVRYVKVGKRRRYARAIKFNGGRRRHRQRRAGTGARAAPSTKARGEAVLRTATSRVTTVSRKLAGRRMCNPRVQNSCAAPCVFDPFLPTPLPRHLPRPVF